MGRELGWKPNLGGGQGYVKTYVERWGGGGVKPTFGGGGKRWKPTYLGQDLETGLQKEWSAAGRPAAEAGGTSSQDRLQVTWKRQHGGACTVDC